MAENQLPPQSWRKYQLYLERLAGKCQLFCGVRLFSSLADANRIKLFWFLCHMEECVINLSALMHMTARPCPII